MKDPIAQAEEILASAEEKLREGAEKAEAQVIQLSALCGLTHEQAHATYVIYAREMRSQAEAYGITPNELQERMGPTHCLLMLGMVAGGVHAGADLHFHPRSES